MLRLVTGFVGQDWPTNGDAIAGRVLSWPMLSLEARHALHGLINAQASQIEIRRGKRHAPGAGGDVYFDEQLRFIAMFAHVEDLEKVRAGLRELERDRLVCIHYLDAIRGENELLRVRMDYDAIADLVGMRRKQHNAPCGPGLMKARGPGGQSDPPFEPMTGSGK